MSLENRRNLDPCHCCEPPSAAAPAQIWNRPALPEVDYRVGTFTSFRQAIFDAIADKAELREWTTRRSEDYGIALTEMWAYLADILTFYQERAVNEAYLRTAQHRDSVLRLAALLGYQINPGVAATADLAFTLEKQKRLQIPVGLRVQSVPAPGEKPQKFETVEAITAEAQLNQVRIYPEPSARDALAVGSDWGIVNPYDADSLRKMLAPGDRLVMFISAPTENWDLNRFEEKEVVSLETVDWQTVLYWKTALVHDLRGGVVCKYQHKFRLFGYDAPVTQLKSFAVPESPTTVLWVELRTETVIQGVRTQGVRTFDLDGLYDDIKIGSRVLVTAGNKDGIFVDYVASVDEVRTERAVISGYGYEDELSEIMGNTVTRLYLDTALPPDFLFERNLITIYKLEGPPISFWPYQYDSNNPALKYDSGVVHIASDLQEAVAKDRWVIFDDHAHRPQTVRITSRSLTDFDGVEHTNLTFTPGLARDLDPATAVLYGNVAQATHGETVASEVLGDGDASADFQQFSLKKSPVTFVPEANTPQGAASTLEVWVDRVRWHEASTLYGQPPDARGYRTRIDDDSITTVQFGDGQTGARLPRGRNNVVATYRQGLGVAGRVGAGSLTKLLDRPAGLKRVTNPTAAEGGADPESLDDARRNAPNTVRTFDRIVSLRDFEDAAREFTGIAKARAAWEWDGTERVVQLTVACDAGAALGPETKESLVAYLDARRDLHRKMRVQDHTPVPALLSMNILSHPDYLPEDVQEAARTALLELFAFENRDLGQGLHLSDLYQVLHEAEGVAAADITALIYTPPQCVLLKLYGPNDPQLWVDWLEEVASQDSSLVLETLEVLRRRGLRFIGDFPEPAQPRLPVYPNELLTIDEPGTDLWLNVRSETS